MKNLRFGLLIVAAALSLAAAGCSGIKPRGITEALVAFQATDASLGENHATLTIRYGNENVSALGFSGAKHKLFLNGTLVGKAVSTVPFGIPPTDAVSQIVTVQLENVALVRQLLAAGSTRTAAYRLESTLALTIYEDNIEYKLTAEGSVDLHAPATAAK